MAKKKKTGYLDQKTEGRPHLRDPNEDMRGKHKHVFEGIRKRTDAEVIRDRAVVMDLHFKGFSDNDIAGQLNDRADIQYSLSRNQIAYDRKAIQREWQDEGVENVAAHIATKLRELASVKKSAWDAWLKSLDDSVSTKTMAQTRVGEMNDAPLQEQIDKVEEFRISQTGNPAYLNIILKCIQDENRLLGAYKFKIQIDTTHTHYIKTYKGWSPKAWDDPVVIDQEAEQEIPSLVDGAMAGEERG